MPFLIVVQLMLTIAEAEQEDERRKAIMQFPEERRAELFAKMEEEKKEKQMYLLEERRHRELCEAIRSTKRMEY